MIYLPIDLGFVHWHHEVTQKDMGKMDHYQNTMKHKLSYHGFIMYSGKQLKKKIVNWKTAVN